MIEKAKLTLQQFHEADISCQVVTGGGTGTYPFEAASGVFTEIQPGSYVLMDVDYNKVANTYLRDNVVLMANVHHLNVSDSIIPALR